MKRLILAAALALTAAPMASAQFIATPGQFMPTPDANTHPVIGVGGWTGIPQPPRNDGCGAGSMQSYVGQPLSYAYATDAAMNARILRPGMITNMMYDAQRLNFHVDSGDTITRIACG
ncbi:MAG: hypothetical protein CL945_06365 [Dinoroseobacter sp.]|jgi:hypothetical protein|nr:hypothetical protein [Dinoroseobacter sp.]